MGAKHAMKKGRFLALLSAALVLLSVALFQTITGDLWHFGVRTVTHRPPSPLDAQRFPTDLLTVPTTATPTTTTTVPTSASTTIRPAGASTTTTTIQPPALVHVAQAGSEIYILPHPLAELQKLGGPIGDNTGYITDEAVGAWAATLGGSPAEQPLVGIKLGSAVPEALPILGVRARVLDRQAPIVGTAIALGSGPFDPKPVMIDLDAGSCQAF